MITGYTQGAFDLFHIGHLNIIKKSSELCNRLIVGVNSDKCIYRYKNKKPFIPEKERLEIIKALKYVWRAELVDDIVKIDNNKFPIYDKFHFDKLFIGDDHATEQRWINVDKYLKKNNAKVEYFPYTKHTSSTKLSKIIDNNIMLNK